MVQLTRMTLNGGWESRYVDTLNVRRPSLPLVFLVCEDGGGEDWKISTVMSGRRKIDTGGMVPDEGS